MATRGLSVVSRSGFRAVEVRIKSPAPLEVSGTMTTNARQEDKVHRVYDSTKETAEAEQHEGRPGRLMEEM